jgi:cell division protein FtsB
VAVKSPLQQHGAGRTFVVRAIFVSLVAVSAYLIFEFGRIKAGYDIIDAADTAQSYEDHIARLDQEIVDLKQEVAILETDREVDRESYREVEASLSTLQAKIQEQRDAIAFYRGIVSPADGNSGLRVQDLKLTRGKAEREFNLRLVLVQAMKHDRKVSGDVSLSVQGDLNGVETSFALAQLLADDADTVWPFSFRYFQDFDRQLVLPDGFTPERINVEVRSKTRSISSIEESFAWATSQS